MSEFDKTDVPEERIGLIDLIRTIKVVPLVTLH